MVKACSAPGCRYQYRKGDNVKMHSFPTNAQLNQKWISAINKPNFTPSKFSVICSQHFMDSDYEFVKGKPILQRVAIPSIFYNSMSIRPIDSRFTQDINELEEEIQMKSNKASNNDSTKECITIEIMTEHTENNKDILVPVEIIDESEEFVKSDTDNSKIDEFEHYIMEECEDDEEYINGKCDTGSILHSKALKFPRSRKQPHFMGDFRYEDLEDPVRRKKYWLMSQQVVEIQRKKLRYWCTKRRALEKKIKSMSKELNELRSDRCLWKGKHKKKKLIYAP